MRVVMEWTSDAPTEAGFYWLHQAHRLLLVRVGQPIGDSRLWVQYHGTKYEETVDHLGGWEWYGPLTPPV